MGWDEKSVAARCDSCDTRLNGAELNGEDENWLVMVTCCRPTESLDWDRALTVGLYEVLPSECQHFSSCPFAQLH